MTVETEAAGGERNDEVRSLPSVRVLLMAALVA